MVLKDIVADVSVNVNSINIEKYYLGNLFEVGMSSSLNMDVVIAKVSHAVENIRKVNSKKIIFDVKILKTDYGDVLYNIVSVGGHVEFKPMIRTDSTTGKNKIYSIQCIVKFLNKQEVRNKKIKSIFGKNFR